MPARIWLVITPELPRAPISAPKLAACATRSTSASGPARSASSSAARTVASHVRAGVAVRDREHVQRVDLVDVRLEAGDRAAERRQEAGAVARPAGHQATSVPLPARSEERGSWLVPCSAGCGALAGIVTQAADADRDAVGFATQRVDERVANRRVDLARDLRDRQAVGDAQVQVDGQRVADLQAQARGRDAEAPQQPADRATAREARHAVRGQRRASDEVADGAPGDQRSTGHRGGHAGDVPPGGCRGGLGAGRISGRAGPEACATIPARSFRTVFRASSNRPDSED